MNQLDTPQYGFTTRITAVSDTLEGMQTTLDQLSQMLRSIKREVSHLKLSCGMSESEFITAPSQNLTATAYNGNYEVTDGNRVKKLISESFTTWCHTGDELLPKYRHFEQLLQATLPGASVQRIFRDLSSSALPVVFHKKEQVKSPAEYWLVESAYEKTLYLLPRPMDFDNFRDCTPVFAGGLFGPRQLGAIEPAVVERSENNMVLKHPGRLISY